MLVIEGGDLVGKTTVVKEIYRLLDAENFNHMPMHLTRPPTCWDYCEGYVSRVHRQTIWDRFHLSSLAYRQLDDHPCALNPTKYGIVDAAIKAVGGMIVVLHASDDVIRDRYQSSVGRDNMYDLPHALDVNRLFKEIVDSRFVKVRGATYAPIIDMVFDTTNTGPLRLAEDIVHQYVMRQEDFDDVAHVVEVRG